MEVVKSTKTVAGNSTIQGFLYDEISGFSPIVINGELSLVK